MQGTQDTQKVMLSIRLEPALHALIKSAAHRREQSIADYVRTTLKEAAEFDVEAT